VENHLSRYRLKAYALKLMVIFCNKRLKKIYAPEKKSDRKMKKSALVGDS
jgi:hypothetical protein